MSEEYKEYTRETLSKALNNFRADVLMTSSDNFDDLPPMAEAHFLKVVALLEQAKAEALLLNYCYMQKM